ncbi:hypothetical protein TraAM80_00604 [Trypanosoma rangeli]|uniref:Uncharacterized protein n=1 Tax=Trypanosoma rangeli TaxID=5698 RepID=A0A3R7RSB8_TRYRA|nr:uncharacterized protein TraAM80_00604 [Trypanosoma rangeli]RNF11909.1 hypothetical protein TraAM80_00604 [Trypanosoma rangeli]|eukprot:RNF11909.1 hypothetical protein TraAM80_00604 [Trypanosoma rangeli]
MSSALYFVCSRCELPICSHKDLIMLPVAGGTTETAFEYLLEDVLALETSVPCYSGDEVAEVNVTVSEEILASILPPATHQLTLETVVVSQHAEQRQQEQNGVETTQMLQPEGSDPSSLTNTLPNSNNGISTGDLPETNPGEDREQNTTDTSLRGMSFVDRTSYQQVMRALASYSRVQETRVDLVCVREEVLGCGLSCCTKGRVTDAPSANSPSASLEEAQNPSSSTQWFAHPGNFIVEESFVKVRRRTKTARCPWFDAYNCRGRLQCPDCHLGLGYLFVRKSKEHPDSQAAACEVKAPSADLMQNGEEENAQDAHEPQQKKERKEEGNERGNKQQQNDDDGITSQFPSTFLGLELKKIRQRQWGLRDFQRRYQQSKNIKSFREMFPEAEELENLYSRLTALRMQAELYNNLLRKHKERNDVQGALLLSQKERIHTYEEKLRTMQQIIEAQREQLEMQGRQIKHQEELVRNHKSQVHTQQQQIHVEQLLLTEQSRTIESQREQLRLIQVHLKARLVKERLDERCEQLSKLLHGLGGERRSYVTTTETAIASQQRISRPLLPPPHLMGVVGHDTREHGEVETETSEERGMVGEATNELCQHHPSRATTPPRDELVASANISRDAVASESRVCPPRTLSMLTAASGSYARSTCSRNLGVSERTVAITRKIAEERARRDAGRGPLPSCGGSISTAASKVTPQTPDDAAPSNCRNSS